MYTGTAQLGTAFADIYISITTLSANTVKRVGLNHVSKRYNGGPFMPLAVSLQLTIVKFAVVLQFFSEFITMETRAGSTSMVSPEAIDKKSYVPPFSLGTHAVPFEAFPIRSVWVKVK